ELYYAFKYSSTGAIIISVISLLILMLFETSFMKKIKLFSFLPGALIVVFVGIFINYLFMNGFPDLVIKDKHLVQLPVASSPSEFISFFTLPDFSFITNPNVYVVAITLAIVASLETLLCVEATDKLDPWKRRTSTNKELIAQGTGNLVSGLLGGLPVTQVIVRSSANINSGGKTKLSAIFHGIILLLSAVFIPMFLNMIPLASLAAILLMVGYKLAKPQIFIQMYKLSKLQFVAFFVTIVAIIATDLLKGIFIGMAVALFYILRRNYLNPSRLTKETKNGKDVYKLRLSEETTFLNKASIAKTLDEIPENSDLIINGEKTYFIAYDVLENIQEFTNYTSKIKNINVTTIGIKEVTIAGGH
ncbi:MAG TPA: SulP family inorganic anion transporter, partial [Vicingus sp.]|nr:SulP family inorganic anion transporter [Vicingus sp.]